jgi:hypothetical protein
MLVFKTDLSEENVVAAATAAWCVGRKSRVEDDVRAESLTLPKVVATLVHLRMTCFARLSSSDYNGDACCFLATDHKSRAAA